ncbi:MAG: aspartate aminotransferase [Bacteriovoracaceae bacterium]|jgi:aspartate aminotransferase
MPFSHRIKSVEGSKSVGLASLVAKLKNEGHDIIGLHVGEPDFPPPNEVIEATQKALTDLQVRYSLVPGIPELREAIAHRFSSRSKRVVSLDNILISNGSKQILYNLFQCLINDGDEVIIPAPYWVTFPESVKLAGGNPIIVNSRDDLGLDLEAIEKAITPKTKMILFNTPNNPTSAVYGKEDLIKLGALATKHDLIIIADEAYESLVFEPNTHTSIAALSDDLFERTITVQTLSKSHCLTGFRIGYMIAPTKYVEEVSKLQSHLNGNVCTFAQHGALKALTMDQTYFEEMIKTMSKRKDLAFKLTKEIFSCHEPQGAFYVFPSLDGYEGRFKSSAEAAEFILREAKVAVLPGSAFGLEGYLRLSFASHEDKIIEAFKRIKEALK